MRLAVAMLYTALTLCANPGVADQTAAAAARAGDMRKLIFHDAPQVVPEARPAWCGRRLCAARW